MNKFSRIIASSVLAAASLAGAAGAMTAPAANAVPSGEYVAIGDSTTAMGSITTVDASNFENVSCGRSKDSYPNQIAAQLGLPLENVSCSGALIDHYWNDRPKAGQIVPAQRNAIGPETGLVTIQMGANPGFVGTVAPACAGAALGSSGNCAPMGGAVDKAALSAQLTDVVRDTRFRAAPGATIALVGYLDEIGNANESCIYTGLMSPDDRRGLQAFLNSVNSVMADVAAREGVTYIAPPATQGWCGQPGVRDVSPLGPISLDDAFPFHPTRQGHTNLANTVVGALR